DKAHAAFTCPTLNNRAHRQAAGHGQVAVGQEGMIARYDRNIPNPGAFMLMNRALSYRGYAAECLELAGTAFSADQRGNMLKMAADWSVLADIAEKREGEAERRSAPPEPEAAPEPVAAKREKPKNRRTARKGSPTELKVSVLRAHPAKARKSRT